jgi:mRNA interferase MazF
MNPGDVVVAHLPTSQGSLKLRPVLILADLPGQFGDMLVCGISTRLHLFAPDWDERLEPTSLDYRSSGLKFPSIIRLSYLGILSPPQVPGSLGTISSERLERLRQRLADHLQQVL